MKQAVLSLSGGMDSTTVLLRLLAEGYKITAIGFDYGQKHKVELDRAKKLVDYLNKNIKNNDLLIKFKIIQLKGLVDLLHSTLVIGGSDVPEGHYEDETMKQTVVPNRNKIFSSIIQAAALSLAVENKIDVKIAMGIHGGDHMIYPDCRPEFRDADYKAFLSGNWEAEKVTYYTPYLDFDKNMVLADGLRCCKILNLDFNEIYKRTLTSYKPIFIKDKWYSDYKSSSSVERIEAFVKLGKKDPLEYADEAGVVSWDTVLEFNKCFIH